MNLRDELNQLAMTSYIDPKAGTTEEVCGHFKYRFIAQKPNIARAYTHESEIREMSKEGIAFLKAGDIDGLENCKADIRAEWAKLGKLDLPADIKWQHDAQAGQEMVEFFTVCWFYSILFGSESEDSEKMLTAEELEVTMPCWLAGIGDSVGELGKLLNDHLCGEELTRDERFALRKKFVALGREIYEFLDQFNNGIPPHLVNNSRRKGYGSTFRGLLGRVRGAIAHQQDALIRHLDEVAR